MIVPLDRWRSTLAEAIGVDEEDICERCNDDEKYGETLCISCLEEELEDESL